MIAKFAHPIRGIKYILEDIKNEITAREKDSKGPARTLILIIHRKVIHSKFWCSGNYTNIRKRYYTSTLFCSTRPARRVARKEFWTARIRKIALFVCNPWDFYKPFLKLGSGLSLALCNNRIEIHVMRTFGKGA